MPGKPGGGFRKSAPRSRRLFGGAVPEAEVVVVAVCTSCRATRDIRAGEVAAGDMPFCHRCGCLMVAKEAVTRRRKAVPRVR